MAAKARFPDSLQLAPAQLREHIRVVREAAKRVRRRGRVGRAEERARVRVCARVCSGGGTGREGTARRRAQRTKARDAATHRRLARVLVRLACALSRVHAHVLFPYRHRVRA